MKLPWMPSTRSPEEWEDADRRVADVRGHIRVLLRELDATLSRIEAKQRRGLPSD